jgi:hypothetical protein
MESERNQELAAILKQLNESTRTGYLAPGQFASTQISHETSKAALSGPTAQANQTLKDGRSPAGPTSAMIDPSKIVTWPLARKYVVEHIYPNPISAAKIRQLIKHQHDQERQWWAEREALISKHRGRAGKRRDVTKMLKSLGGAVVHSSDINPEEDAAKPK